MGQEQSNTRPGMTNPQNIPYTKYSVEKSSPKGKTKREKAKLEDIVVVAGAQSRMSPSRTEDPDIKRLYSIPTIRPILHASVQLQGTVTKEFESLERFDLRPAFKLCSRYEDHLRQCAEAVSFDQDMVSSRVKEVDVNCSSVLSVVNDRYRRLIHLAAHLKKVEEMSLTLQRIDASMKRIVPLMDRLNNILPEDERLQPFSFEPSASYGIQ